MTIASSTGWSCRIPVKMGHPGGESRIIVYISKGNRSRVRSHNGVHVATPAEHAAGHPRAVASRSRYGTQPDSDVWDSARRSARRLRGTGRFREGAVSGSSARMARQAPRPSWPGPLRQTRERWRLTLRLTRHAAQSQPGAGAANGITQESLAPPAPERDGECPDWRRADAVWPHLFRSHMRAGCASALASSVMTNISHAIVGRLSVAAQQRRAIAVAVAFSSSTSPRSKSGVTTRGGCSPCAD